MSLKKRRFRRGVYLALGYAGLALGAVGVAVPLLPAWPFLALAAWGFSRGDERVHQWFIGTKFYKENLESFLRGRGMTRRAKVRVMLTVTACMALGAWLMRRIPLGQIVLFFVWIGHLLLFAFGIQTVPENSDSADPQP